MVGEGGVCCSVQAKAMPRPCPGPPWLRATCGCVAPLSTDAFVKDWPGQETVQRGWWHPGAAVPSLTQADLHGPRRSAPAAGLAWHILCLLHFPHWGRAGAGTVTCPCALPGPDPAHSRTAQLGASREGPSASRPLWASGNPGHVPGTTLHAVRASSVKVLFCWEIGMPTAGLCAVLFSDGTSQICVGTFTKAQLATA